MRLPVIPTSELEAARAERDAWRFRAESLLRGEPVSEREVRRRSGGRRVRRLLGTSFLAVVSMLGAGLLVSREDAARRADYPACIGKARYEHPVQGNQYQELVNALYTCAVYEVG